MLLEYDWTFSIVEHGRNFSPAIVFGFLYDQELAKEVLFTLSSFTRTQMLDDCSIQLNLTTRGLWSGKKLHNMLEVGGYVGPLRWILSTQAGEKLWELSSFCEEAKSSENQVSERLRSEEYSLLWREILMNIAVASDLRSEQLVKLVKTWPEVGSRNILSWWQKVIFATQEDLINPLPYISPYTTTFRPIDLFATPAKKLVSQKPRLLLSLRDGVPNEYSRVWPLLTSTEFAAERAVVNKQRTCTKGKGFNRTLAAINHKISREHTPPQACATFKRNQASRESPLDNASARSKKPRKVGSISSQADEMNLPVKKIKPVLSHRRSARRSCGKPSCLSNG